MARPQKNNADYFPHDADMRNDPKIKALRRKFKHTGYAVWGYILESLADSDFFEIEWSDLNVELLAADFDIEPGELREIVAYSSTLGLLQTDNGILTCEKLKLRFKPLLAKRKPDKSEFPEQKPQENGVSDIQNPQSKVKESKGNKSKESSDEDYMSGCPRTQDDTKPDLGKSKEAHPPIPAAPLPNPDPINYRDLVVFFNAETKGVFGMITYPLSEKRRSNVRARIREYGKDSFAKMIRLAARSDFLKGDKGDFKATFDWLIKPSNFQKVLDGNYENRIKSSGTNPQSDERLMQNIAAGYERGLKEREDRGV